MTMALSESILLTSIPLHLKRVVQGTDFGPAWLAACIRSWKDAGFRVISLNTADEVNGIRSFAPDVDFLEIPNGHHRPLITDFFTAAAEIDAEIAGIINADCLLIDQMGLARRLANHLDGLAVVERFNVDRNTLHPTGQTCFGFDAFFFTTAALPAIECNASWRIGDNWWDYWLPLTFYFAGFEPRTLPLIYLPKYSPDFNPIELAFSKLKAHLRKAAEHTILRLPARIGRIVTDFSPQECRNFFRHACYART
jgi:hypothetical protein